MSSTSAPNSAFRTALLQGQPVDPDPVRLRWINYALATNDRGREVVEKLVELGCKLKGQRLLDIGSGYGGVCIQAALAGAESIGLEPDERLVGIAHANLSDHPPLPVTFLTQSAVADGLPEKLGQFQVIVCDNVIEHAEFPERLIQIIGTLLAPGGLLYMTLPNARSIGQVMSDCHFQLFGATLLEPDDAEEYVRSLSPWIPSYNVTDYFGWEYYASKFEKYEMTPQLINAWPNPDQALPELERRLPEVEVKMRQVWNNPSVAQRLKQKLDKRVQQYLEIARSDLKLAAKAGEGHAANQFRYLLVRDYLVELWYGVIRKRA